MRPVRITRGRREAAPSHRIPVRETFIVRACLEYLAAKHILAWRSNSGAIKSSYTNRHGQTKERFVRFNGMPGMSDICAVRHGRFLAIEVKRPGEVVTELQREFLDAVTEAGGLGICVHSVDELDAVLSGHTDE